MKLFKKKDKEMTETLDVLVPCQVKVSVNEPNKETEIQKELKHLKEYVNILDSNHILGLMTDKEYQHELMLINNSVSELERVLL